MKPLILFDFDDTIAPTGDIGEKILAEVIAEQLGERYPENQPLNEIIAYLERHDITGLTVQQKLHLLNEEFNLDIDLKADIDTIRQAIKERKLAQYEDGTIKPYQGLEDALQTLEANDYPMAIVSNGTLDRIEKALSIFGLDRFFSDIYASNIFDTFNNIKPKPSGDLISYARDHMSKNHSFDQIIYIGDNSNDIKAAKEAGANRVFIYMPKGDKYNQNLALEYKAMGAEVFSDYRELPELLDDGSLGSTPEMVRTPDVVVQRQALSSSAYASYTA